MEVHEERIVDHDVVGQRPAGFLDRTGTSVDVVEWIAALATARR